MLYVGANDGMLHAFDADTGVEQFAFIPNGVYDNLVRLTSPTYSHKYFVDASPFIGDAYIDDDQDMNNIIASANRRWRTVLVGATGAGGRSVFALDVSDPDNFTQADILWEFTDPDLGYTIGQPVAARMANGDWAAIFGNGYNSDNGKAFLFIVNLETGALIKKIDTGIGSTTTPNGLGTPALLADGQGVISTAYAGDLYGNIWKFDLSASNEGSNNTSGWTSAFKSGSTLLPFFTAKDSSAVAQPITAPLNIGTNPNGGYMIYFGTGKYFEDNDKYVGSNPQVQSFYALWDDGTRISTTDRSELTHQVIFSETADWRSVEQATGSQPASPRGWYLDLESPVNGAEGERIVSEPLLRNGRAIFTTLTPDSDPCSWGGTSWVMELTSTTGTVAGAVFDTNGDGLINAADSSVSGQKVGAIISTPKVISYGNGETEGKYAGDSSGGITVIKEQGSSGNPLVGRRSWRIVH